MIRGMIHSVASEVARVLAAGTVGDIVATGNLVIDGSSTARGGHVGQPRLVPGTPSDTSPLTTTAGRCYAFYVGQAARDLTSVDVLVHLGTAAVAGAGGASANWAEIGIATGTLESLADGGTTDLTIRGYASIDTEAKSGAANQCEKTISNINIAAGTGLWVVVAGSYETTQMGVRTWDGADITGRSRIRASCQPSANIDSPLTFTASAAIFPVMHIRYPA